MTPLDGHQRSVSVGGAHSQQGGPIALSHLGGSAGEGLLYGRGVVAASPGDIAAHVVALGPLGPSVAMEGNDRGRHAWRGASDVQPCPGACLPALEEQLRDPDAVESVDDRRGMVNASTGILRAGGRACGALAPGRG